MIAPSGNGSLPSRYASIATSLPRMARISLRLPSSWATEINRQSRYPAGILTPKIGELSSSAPPAENVIAPLTLAAMAAAITKIGICFMDRPFIGLSDRLTQGPECGSELRAEKLRLLPGRKVAAFVELVVMDEVGIRPLRPTPRSRVDLVGESAHG